ncbi:MAG TPA: hypothetical protein DCS97_16275 [Planctomycetes bacterium]|nr:hypothetical protein [Planctomycetota bacterium]
MIPRLLLAAFLVCAVLPAAQNAPNPLDQAEVSIRVRDGRWVDREVTRFAAAYGGDLVAMRSELARVLYRSRSFDGIDLGRPSVIAWRKGRSPLIVVIPISDRGKFLDSFGVVDAGEPPLVRVGERDGTVIYRQNQPGGEWEYRLLVAANTAFLTRSVEECRQLATSVGSLVAEPFGAPVEATLRGSGLLNPHIPGTDWMSALPALPIDLAEINKVPGLLPQAWQDLSSQVAAITLTAQSGAQGDLRLTARLTAKPETPLAGWIPTQRPSAERLAGQLRSPATALLISGRLSFQGQFERWAFEQADTLRTAAAARWNETADGAFRGLCTLLERCGAWSLSVERSGPGLLQLWAVEHPRAVEVVQYVATIVGVLQGVEPDTARVLDRDATSLAVPGGTSILVAGDRHAVRLDDRGAKRALAAAGEAVKRLETTGGLDAEPALVSLWMDLALAWNAPIPAEQERADPVIVRAALRPAGAASLEFIADLPIARLGVLLGRLNKILRND